MHVHVSFVDFLVVVAYVIIFRIAMSVLQTQLPEDSGSAQALSFIS